MDFWNGITVTDIESVMTIPSARGRRLNIHNRKNYGLSFCLGDGRIVYTRDDKKYESNHSVAILLPMGQSYSLHCPETGDFPLINFTACAESAGEEFVVTRLQNPEPYLRDCERLREAHLVRRDRAKTMSILYEIFGRLAHEDEQNGFRPIRPAEKYLTEHFSDPALTASVLAARVGLSEVYFRRLFKEAYGIPPKQYILELRIRHACLLLAENSATVTEISKACGFSSVYHFCRAFRSAMGETPSEYRKKELF